MGKADLIIPLGVLGLGYLAWKRLQTPLVPDAPGIQSPQGAQSGRHRRGGDGQDDPDPLDITDVLNGVTETIPTNGEGLIETIENIFEAIVSPIVPPPKFISVERPDAWWDIPAYTPVSPDYIQAGEGIDEWI